MGGHAVIILTQAQKRVLRQSCKLQPLRATEPGGGSPREASRLKVLKLAATLIVTATLAVIGATTASATTHESLVSGFEFYATSTTGNFAGTATATGTDGLSGAWSISVDHSDIGRCTRPGSPCAAVTGGGFSLAVTSPRIEMVSGSFDSPSQAAAAHQLDEIALVNPGYWCRNQVFSITDSLHGVGTSQHIGTGTFTANLTHYRYSAFGRCIT